MGKGDFAGPAARAAAAAFAKTGDVEGALKPARPAGRRDMDFMFSGMVAAGLVRAGELAHALALAQGLPGEAVRAEVLSFVAAAQADAGKTTEALRTATLTIMTEPSGDGVWYPLLAAWAQAKAGDTGGAITTVRRIEDKKDRDRTLYAVAMAQVGAGDLSGAIETANSLAGQTIKGLELWNFALYQGGAGKLTAALDTPGIQLFGPMDLKAALLGAVAATQAKQGNVGEAKRIASLLLEGASTADEDIRGSWLTSAVAAQARIGDAERALDIARSIGDPAARAKALAQATRAAAQAGDLAAAGRFADLALSTAASLNDSESRFAAVWAAANSGQTATALDVARRIRRNDRGYALLLAAAVRAEAGDVTGATTLAKNLIGEEDVEIVLRRIAAVQAKAGDSAAAIRSLARERDAASGSYRALQEVAKSESELGSQADARDTLAKAVLAAANVKDPAERADALVEVARSQAGIGATAAARKTAALALGAAKDDKLDHRQRDIVIALARLLAELDDRAGARTDLAPLRDAAAAFANADCRAEALAAVAQAQIRTGDAAEARRTLAIALEAVSEIAQSPRCLQYAEATERQSQMLIAVAKAQAEMGDAGAAGESISRAIGMAQTLTDPAKRANVLGDIAEAQALMGAVAAAHGTAALALDAAASLSDPPPREAALL
ncbi:MAG: hypothetical protein ACREE7_19195, partial [Dongiaceae bacterium]